MKPSQPQLLSVLGLSTAILLVAGNMIGSGVFKKIAPMSAGLGDETLILLAWLVAGLITMLGAFSFASLATTTSEAGGQFQYFKNVFGDFFGFMYGWSFFTVISTASIASIAYVFAESSVHLFGLSSSVFGFADSTAKFIAISTLVVLTVVNIMGVKNGGMLANIVTSAKIMGIVFLIVLGLTYVAPEPAVVAIAPVASEVDFIMLSAFFTAMLGAFWAYDGWVNITNMASEFKNPTRTIPLAIIAGTALTMLLYIAVNYAYLQVLTPTALASLDGKIAAVEVADVAMGGVGAMVISVLIMVSTFGATAASTMSAARVYYQMARESLFFAPFAKVHPKYHTPHISLMGQMLWASLLILSGTFDQLTDMLIFAAFIFYAMGAIAVIKLKRQGKLTLTFGYPVVPVLFLFFSTIIVFNALYTRPLESLSGLGLMLLGVPFYLYFRDKRSTNEA